MPTTPQLNNQSSALFSRLSFTLLSLLSLKMLRTVRLSRAGIIAARGYASTATATAGAASQLTGVAAQAAQEISSKWEGTSATGGNTKNYINGKFVESKATKWFDVNDPVSGSGHGREITAIVANAPGHPDTAHPCPPDHCDRV